MYPTARRFAALGAFIVSTSCAPAARADALENILSDAFLPLFALSNLIPAGIGGGVSNGEDGAGFSILLSWPMQIPIGKADFGGRELKPPLRFVIEPIASFGSEGTEFQLRTAPRIVVTPWRRTGLFASAGTTARFAPFEPSAHLELGALRSPDDGGIKVWLGVRGDQWFAGTVEQRIVAMVGWSLY